MWNYTVLNRGSQYQPFLFFNQIISLSTELSSVIELLSLQVTVTGCCLGLHETPGDPGPISTGRTAHLKSLESQPSKLSPFLSFFFFFKECPALVACLRWPYQGDQSVLTCFICWRTKKWFIPEIPYSHCPHYRNDCWLLRGSIFCFFFQKQHGLYLGCTENASNGHPLLLLAANIRPLKLI